MNIAINADCMDVMKTYPDQYFDLAVVDPPYGGSGKDYQDGSGSSRRAAYDFGFDFVGIEVDKEYFEMQEKAFQEYTAQFKLDI